MMSRLSLNPEQQKAVEHGAGPLLILAGAGSGKTRVLVQRIAMLIKTGDVRPFRILAVTFTNKAAGEMKERLRSLLGTGANTLWIGTFHSVCARLLRRYADRIDLPRDFTIIDTDDQRRLIKDILKSLNVSSRITPKAILYRIDQAKNKNIDPRSINESPLDQVVGDVYTLYQSRLKKEHLLDFNDLLLRVLDLAKIDRALLSDLFDHVLVDEFQDTNLVQYELVRLFCERTNNITVVGDDDQSIYAWRGAEPRNLLDFEQDFPDATAIHLEQNYRSTDVILSAANAIISNNKDRHVKTLWTDRRDGAGIVLRDCHNERIEAEFIADNIARQYAPHNIQDVAVLYRTHAQSRVLEEALLSRNIPYKIIGSISFFARKEIKDIRAYVKLMLHTTADSAMERIINIPRRGIGAITLERLKTYSAQQGLSLFDAAKACAQGEIEYVTPAASKKIDTFVSLIERLKALIEDESSMAAIFKIIIEKTGYIKMLNEADFSESEDRLENLEQLVAMAAEFDERHQGAETHTLWCFEESISLTTTDEHQNNDDGPYVTLMTIHAAKGLEYPVIFLTGLEEGLFPSIRGDEDDPELALEEERRLAYVAITRARDRLILSYARSRRRWDRMDYAAPSCFLDEIPETCFEKIYARKVSQQKTSKIQHQDSTTVVMDYSDDGYEVDVPTIDADADIKSANDAISTGSIVSHRAFGHGVVLATEGDGETKKLTIRFSGEGVKMILAKFVELD